MKIVEWNPSKMINVKFYLSLFLISFYVMFSFASAATIKPLVIKLDDSSADQLNKKINKILAEFGENLNIGILVQNISTGKDLYKKNVDRYFMPASNQKLLTAFAALNYLNPNFTYQTRLFVDPAQIRGGVLNDNIYLQFTGDPTLTVAELDGLINALAHAGVQRINGNIIIDDTAFDQGTMSPGTTWDDQKFCFGSPISALIIDHNCITANLIPAASKDLPATLQLPNQPQFVKFVNRVVTRSPSANCELDLNVTNDTTYELSGCMKTTDSAKYLQMAVSNPRAYMQSVLIYLLNKNHIANPQRIVFQPITNAPKMLAAVASQPLPMMISTMLKDSDNVIANSLFKTMGQFYTQQPGSWQNGHDALRNIFSKKVQLNMSKATIVDGAGGSRYNYLTPQQIVTLLRKAYASPYGSIFIAALPVSGVDGTLKARMNTPAVLGKVRAKTGTETAVTTLSGYLETRKKHTLVFSIMINGFVDQPAKYKALEDEICAALVDIG